MDWNQKFEGILNRYTDISKAHVFEFTSLGMRSKQYADDPQWNKWNNIKPTDHHMMLQDKPTGLLKPMKPYELSNTKKQDLKKALDYVPKESPQFLQDMLSGGLGFDLQSLDCLHDFTNDSSNVVHAPVTIQPQFRTKKQHLSTQPPNRQKRSAKTDTIGATEIRELLATQSPDEQAYYSNF